MALHNLMLSFIFGPGVPTYGTWPLAIGPEISIRKRFGCRLTLNHAR